MITVDCNPAAFLSAGILSVKSATVLAIVGRAGISGASVKDLAAGGKIPTSTVHSCTQLLAKMGMVHNCGIDRKQGCPHRYAVTPKGQEVLNKAIMAIQHPDRLQAPLSLDS